MDLYRLNFPTLGIQTKDGIPSPVVVPGGALLSITGSLLERDGFVRCLWCEAEVMLMATDMKWRTERVQATAEGQQKAQPVRAGLDSIRAYRVA